jgi:hypothetical protein
MTVYCTLQQGHEARSWKALPPIPCRERTAQTVITLQGVVEATREAMLPRTNRENPFEAVRSHHDEVSFGPLSCRHNRLVRSAGQHQRPGANQLPARVLYEWLELSLNSSSQILVPLLIDSGSNGLRLREVGRLVNVGD